MRIPEEEIERIKREVSIVRLVEAKGVKLSGHGDNLMGLCPLPGHNDKNPSLVVSPSKNVFHCLGKCQTGGSVIDWVMKAERVSFRLAVEMLKKESPYLAAPRGWKKTGGAPLEQVSAPDARGEVLLRRVVDYYRRQVTEPEVAAYLDKRGLLDAELVEHFSLGYSNRTLGHRLPSSETKAGDEIRKELCRIGIYRKTGHEHFLGSLIVPVLDDSGRVREIYGRKIGEDLHKGSPRHLYLPSRGEGRGVFDRMALRASREVIVCEALIDAMT
jgi:DNA primase